MNRIKTTAAVLMLSTAILPLRVYAVPEGMGYTIETKELKTEEIPADRTISLSICSEGLPPFVKLRVLLLKDSALEFNGYNVADLCPDISRECGMSLMFSPQTDTNFAALNFGVFAEGPFDYNGELCKLNVVLPENCKPGDYYEVRILNTFTSNLEYDTMVRDDDVRYGKDCFSKLQAGGIRIIQEGLPNAPAPVYQEEPQPDAPQNPQDNDDSTGQDHDAPEETTAAITTTADETTVTASDATETMPILTTGAETSIPQTETETTTAAATETTPLPDAEASAHENQDRSALITVLIGIAAAGSGTGTVVSRNRKQQKRGTGL